MSLSLLHLDFSFTNSILKSSFHNVDFFMGTFRKGDAGQRESEALLSKMWAKPQVMVRRVCIRCHFFRILENRPFGHHSRNAGVGYIVLPWTIIQKFQSNPPTNPIKFDSAVRALTFIEDRQGKVNSFHLFNMPRKTVGLQTKGEDIYDYEALISPGITMLKFGRGGTPHERLFRLSGDLRYLTWYAGWFCSKSGGQCHGKV